MQPLKTVKGTIVRTTILDRYLNVQIEPVPFCAQGKRQFYMVDVTDHATEHYVLKTMEHSTDAEEFNVEVETLLEGWNLNKALSANPHIAKVLDVRLGKEPGTGRIYSETLLEDCGENLLDYCDNHDVSLAELTDYGDQTIQAMHFAHEQVKCFHGDLRPEKLFVKKGILKVLDFGGALFIGSTNDANTRKLLSTWSTGYWPPEKFAILDSGLSKADKLAVLSSFDVYSWGMTFYQLLTHKTEKELEKENILYKQTQDAYRGFNKMVLELATTVKPVEDFRAYFEPLLRIALEFDPTKRATLLGLRDHSYHNRGAVVRHAKDPNRKKEKIQAAVDEEEANPGTKKGMCHTCMKERNTAPKAILECTHKVCEQCIMGQVDKVLIERAAPAVEFFCYICKEKKKLS